MGLADRLILPGAGMAGCVFAALVRDTRGRDLAGADLFNHFPASPLVAVTWVFEGAIHGVSGGVPDPAPLPALSVAGPQAAPVTSWCPGPVHALTLGLFPEAWAALSGADPGAIAGRVLPLDRAVGGPLLAAFVGLSGPGGLGGLEAALRPLWHGVRPGPAGPARRIEDWTRALATRAATGGAGRSLRQAQRRVRAGTGQSARSLEAYARIDALHRMVRAQEDDDLADLAQQAGYADQSHMGRQLRQVTGQSPAALLRQIDRDEAFWAYRLLGTLP